MKVHATMIAALAAILFLHSAVLAGDAPQPLKKDDRIVFLGDSITAAGVKPQGYVTLLTEAIKVARLFVSAVIELKLRFFPSFFNSLLKIERNLSICYLPVRLHMARIRGRMHPSFLCSFAKNCA